MSGRSIRIPAFGRSLMAMSGPAIYSAANFLAALAIQQRTESHIFGLYAFAQIVIALGQGLSNAIFGSPLVVALAQESPATDETLHSFNLLSYVFSALFALVVLVASTVAGAPLLNTLLFSALTFVTLQRWFFRSLRIARRRNDAAVISDIIYGVLLVAALGGLVLADKLSLAVVTSCQALAVILSSVAIFSRPPLAASLFRLAPFIRQFRQHGKWAAVGVVATEATANSYAYIVALVCGPAAFAPLAAVALFYRPLGVTMMALTQFERPQMAESYAKRALDRLSAAVRTFALCTGVVWAMNAGAVLGLTYFAPGTVGASYDPGTVQIAALLITMVNLATAFRGPPSAAMQAAGQFRGLAMATITSGPLSLGLVLLLVFLWPERPVFTLIGPMLGEAVNCVIVWVQYRRMRRAAGG